MNSFGAYKKLFVIQTTDEKNDFYKFAMKYIERGEQVLIVARETRLLLPLLQQFLKSRDMLQMLTIMYPTTMQDVAEKLVELNDWKEVPILFVIDLCDYVLNYNSIQLEYQQILQEHIPFSEDLEKEDNCTPLFPILCYCLSSVVHFVNTQQKVMMNKLAQTIDVVVLLPFQSDQLTTEQLQLLIDLYFYGDDEVFNNCNELIKSMEHDKHK